MINARNVSCSTKDLIFNLIICNQNINHVRMQVAFRFLSFIQCFKERFWNILEVCCLNTIQMTRVAKLFIKHALERLKGNNLLSDRHDWKETSIKNARKVNVGDCVLKHVHYFFLLIWQNFQIWFNVQIISRALISLDILLCYCMW
jgi:hypothetical protein